MGIGVMANFTDLVSGQECALVFEGITFTGGIKHPRCDVLADLSMDLDAFYCPACKWNGRVSGAWCADVLEAAKKASR